MAASLQTKMDLLISNRLSHLDRHFLIGPISPKLRLSDIHCTLHNAKHQQTLDYETVWQHQCLALYIILRT